MRRCVELSSAVPGNWQTFLRIDENKTELFSFLATRVTPPNMQVLTTLQVDVLCTNRQDVFSLAPCTHEEADTHMLLHLEDVVHKALGPNRCVALPMFHAFIVLEVARGKRTA